MNSYAALSKCRNLRILNLEFVSEFIDLPRLFGSIRKLPDLEQLYLSRVHVEETDRQQAPIEWPTNLKHLAISDSISHRAALYLNSAPNSLRSFRIESPVSSGVEYLVISTSPVDTGTPKPERSFGHNLDSLETYTFIAHAASEYNPDGNSILTENPHLRQLTLHASWVWRRLLPVPGKSDQPHPLETLKISFGGIECHVDVGFWEWEVRAVFDAVSAGYLNNLRRVYLISNFTRQPKWSISLSTEAGSDEESDEDVDSELAGESAPTLLQELAQVMEALETERAERSGKGYSRRKTGVWVVPWSKRYPYPA